MTPPRRTRSGRRRWRCSSASSARIAVEMEDQATPVRLNLKKDEKLEIEWRDGRRSTYRIEYLRSMCPCAVCKGVRAGHGEHPPAIGTVTPKKTSLTILPGNYATPLSALKAELVGN